MPTSVPAQARTERAAATEEEQWRELYDRNIGWVDRLIARLGVSDLDREDIAQRAFELAFRRGKAGLPVEEVGPWLRGTVVNLVRNHRRWSRIRTTRQWIVQSLFGQPVQSALPALEARSQIHLVLAQMTPALRDVLVLADAEEIPIDEVASMLGIPLNTARWRRTQARERFRALWREAEGAAHD